MKKIRMLFTLLFLFCLLYSAKAQLPVIPQNLDKADIVDSMVYEITYEVNIVNNPKEPQKSVKDVQILQIGTRTSKTYSKLLYQADSTATVLAGKKAEHIPIFQEFVSPVIIHKNFPDGKYTTIYRTFISGPILEYEEKTPEITWNLQSEKKTIHGYVCQKATTTFRGRTYEAWFAPEIPLKDGPYKFHGLPGLILQLSDSQHHYIYNCIGIQKSKVKEPVLFWKWNIQKATKNEVDKLVKRMYQNPAGFAESLGTKLRYVDRSESETKKISYPYNPIELE